MKTFARIQTLDLQIMSRVFCHCATATELNFSLFLICIQILQPPWRIVMYANWSLESLLKLIGLVDK
jgi:hypothetical protein